MKLHLKRAIILIGIAVMLLGLVSCYNVRTYYLIEMDGMKTEELCELLNFTVEEVREFITLTLYGDSGSFVYKDSGDIEFKGKYKTGKGPYKGSTSITLNFDDGSVVKGVIDGHIICLDFDGLEIWVSSQKK